MKRLTWSDYFWLGCVVYTIALTVAAVILFWNLWFLAFIQPDYRYYVIIDVNSVGEGLLEFWLFVGYIFALINVVAGYPYIKKYGFLKS
ncbi:MAG: hypothetical protein WC359_13840 [Dehalococcoidia bacterium]|jgi:hypothetical protein